MKTTKFAAVIVSASALALAGCGSDNDADVATPDDTAMAPATDVAIAYPVAGDLTSQQQANLDAMDWQAVSDEYDTNYTAMNSATPSPSATATDSMSDSSSGGSGTMTMPPREQMDFSFLDRNGDGKLSVAEYAIWAVPANPTSPAPNDAKAPHLTQDQINQAGQTFFYFDQDGSTYLSPEEFETARNSARTA